MSFPMFCDIIQVDRCEGDPLRENTTRKKQRSL